MLKLILTVLLPFLAPLIAYNIWHWVVMRRYGRSMRRSLWAWCLLLGAILSVLSIFIFGLHVTAKDPGLYHPPVLRDGRVIPGGFD